MISQLVIQKKTNAEIRRPKRSKNTVQPDGVREKILEHQTSV
jgi:hypothetical protein